MILNAVFPIWLKHALYCWIYVVLLIIKIFYKNNLKHTYIEIDFTKTHQPESETISFWQGRNRRGAKINT